MSKFQSISDVYNLQVLNELAPGEVEIYAKTSDESPAEPIGTIDDNYYKVLKKLVLTRGPRGVDEELVKILDHCRWEDAGGLEYVNDVKKLVINKLVEADDVEIDPEKFREFTDRKVSDRLTAIDSHIRSGKIFNILDALKSDLKFTNNPKSLIKAIWKVAPAANVVGVGPGEICLSLFTNAIKGDVGDLQVAGLGEVELKSDSGRLGTSNYTHKITETYPEILRRSGKDIMLGEEIRKAEDNFTKILEMLVSKLDHIFQIVPEAERMIIQDVRDKIADPEFFSIAYDTQSLWETMASPWKQQLVRIYDDNPMIFAGQYDKKLFVNAVKDPKRKGITNLIDDLIHQKVDLDKIRKKQLPPSDSPLSWTKTLQNFMLVNHGLERRDIITALAEVRTEPMQLQIGELTEAINKVVTPEMFKTLRGANMKKREVLVNLVSTIQMISYQSVHNFPYLLLCNASTLDAIAFDFTGGSLRENFIKVWKQVQNPRITNNLNVDERNKGVSMILK